MLIVWFVWACCSSWSPYICSSKACAVGAVGAVGAAGVSLNDMRNGEKISHYHCDYARFTDKDFLQQIDKTSTSSFCNTKQYSYGSWFAGVLHAHPSYFPIENVVTFPEDNQITMASHDIVSQGIADAKLSDKTVYESIDDTPVVSAQERAMGNEVVKENDIFHVFRVTSPNAGITGHYHQGNRILADQQGPVSPLFGHYFPAVSPPFEQPGHYFPVDQQGSVSPPVSPPFEQPGHYFPVDEQGQFPPQNEPPGHYFPSDQQGPDQQGLVSPPPFGHTSNGNRSTLSPFAPPFVPTEQIQLVKSSTMAIINNTNKSHTKETSITIPTFYDTEESTKNETLLMPKDNNDSSAQLAAELSEIPTVSNDASWTIPPGRIRGGGDDQQILAPENYENPRRHSHFSKDAKDLEGKNNMKCSSRRQNQGHVLQETSESAGISLSNGGFLEQSINETVSDPEVLDSIQSPTKNKKRTHQKPTSSNKKPARKKQRSGNHRCGTSPGHTGERGQSTKKRAKERRRLQKNRRCPHKNTNNDLSTYVMQSLEEQIPRKKGRVMQNSPTQDEAAAIRASVTPSPTMVSPMTQPKEGPKESLELPRIIFDKAASGLPKFGLVVGRVESRWTDTFWHSQRSLPEAQAALSQMVDSFLHSSSPPCPRFENRSDETAESIVAFLSARDQCNKALEQESKQRNQMIVEKIRQMLDKAYKDQENGHGLLCFEHEPLENVSCRKGWSGTYVEVLRQHDGSAVMYVGQTSDAYKRNQYKPEEAKLKNATSLGIFSLSSQDMIDKYIPEDLIDMIAKTDYYQGTVEQCYQTIRQEIARMLAEAVQAAAIPSITKVVCETFLMESEYWHAIRAPCSKTMGDLVSFLEPCGPVVEVGTWPTLKSRLFELAASRPDGILSKKGICEPEAKFLKFWTLVMQFASHFGQEDGCFVNASPCEIELELQEEVIQPMYQIFEDLEANVLTKKEALDACHGILKTFSDSVHSRPEGDYKRTPKDKLADDTKCILESLLGNECVVSENKLICMQTDAFASLCVYHKEWMEETFPLAMRKMFAPHDALVGLHSSTGNQRVLVHPAWFKLFEFRSANVNLNMLNSYCILSQALQYLGWKTVQEAEREKATLISFFMQRKRSDAHVASRNCLPKGLNENVQMINFAKVSGKTGIPLHAMIYLIHEFEPNVTTLNLLNEVFDHIKQTNPKNPKPKNRQTDPSYVNPKQKANAEHWEACFQSLQEYRATNGLTVPPYKTRLCRWIKKQQYLFKKGKLLEERNSKLKSMGFDMSKAHFGVTSRDELKFATMVEAASKFYEDHRHWEVPDPRVHPDTEYAKLYYWIKMQRRNRKTSKLAQDRIDRLEKIGFPWIAPKAKGTSNGEFFEDSEDNWDSDGEQMVSSAKHRISKVQ